ncbi:MAG TPA: glycosyltransferase, partial [Solirubrobacteraceae bacterium]
LLEQLAARPGIDLRVIYQAADEPGWDMHPDWFVREHDYDALTLRSWQRARAGRTPLVWPRGVERELDRFDPGCVIAWEYGPAALRAQRWCRRRGRAHVVFSELTPDSAMALGTMQLRLHSRVARRAAGFVAASSSARARLLALGVPADAIEVSLQSVDASAIRAARARAHDRGSAGAGPLRVLTVGRLVADKNIAALIDAAGEGVALEICGDGPLRAELQARAGANVIFSGYVAPADLPAVYARADAFALVSTFEPFGVALREAVAAGLPVVCSRAVGAAADLALEGRNALLVDPGATEQIAIALARLAADPGLRARMAAESVAIDAAHDIDASVDAFARAITRAVGP